MSVISFLVETHDYFVYHAQIVASYPVNIGIVLRVTILYGSWLNAGTERQIGLIIICITNILSFTRPVANNQCMCHLPPPSRCHILHGRHHHYHHLTAIADFKCEALRI